MKFTKTTILTGSFLLLFSLPSAGEKSVEKGHFLGINSNIKNEKLRAELEVLMLNFDVERQKIHDNYTEEIEKLKEERSLEVKSIKKEFGEKREALLIKYGENRKLMNAKPDQVNLPDNEKRIEDKKLPRIPK